MARIKAIYLFAGFGDYFGGYGTEQGKSALLYASYSTDTSLRDIVNQLADEVCLGSACEELPEDITSEEVHAAILDSLTERGLEDYHTGKVSECSITFAEDNGWKAGVALEDQVAEDDQFACDESPVIIFLIECEICVACGDCSEHFIGELCEGCSKVLYPEDFDEKGTLSSDPHKRGMGSNLRPRVMALSAFELDPRA